MNSELRPKRRKSEPFIELISVLISFSWLKSRHTTPDVIANFEDLKVLGKGDFKALMKWRLAIRLEIGLDVKADKTQDATEEVVVEPMDEEEQITEELQKLQQAKLAKTKKERKRANEKKARDLLKLQLNMTVPDDLDQNDLALQGEEEIFDLEEGENEARRRGKKGGLAALVENGEGMDLSSESEEEDDEDEEDDEILDSDEERERKTAALEGELDGLYDSYVERKKERDAKWKVKQDRLKDKNFDAWHGIQEKSDEEGSDDDDGQDDDEEGGWDVVAQKKAKYGEGDSSDSDSDAEPETEAPKKSKKVSFENAARSEKSSGLMTSLREPELRAQRSKQAQLWFDQPVFKNVGDLAALDGDDEEEEEEDESEEEESADEDVDMEDASESSSTLEGDDDFEIVPQAPEDDGPEWDVDDEDQDEVKKKVIQGMFLSFVRRDTQSLLMSQTRVFLPPRPFLLLPPSLIEKPLPISSLTKASTVSLLITRTVFPLGSLTTNPSFTSPTFLLPRRLLMLSVLDRGHWMPGPSRRSLRPRAERR